MKWKKGNPCLKPHIGCLSCGAREMRKKDNVITAAMNTRIYSGFRGWYIKKNRKIIYIPPRHANWKEFPTLMKFENMARKDPDNDWRARCELPLRDATYQRQGKNKWVLIKSGKGFA